MRVYFVGAGPGDPDLLTKKAERLIKEAKVCIYAGSLVSPAVLKLLPVAAARHDSASLTLGEVITIILKAKESDLDVIRLHSGDPSIYGAIGEQIEILTQHGIEYEVVPGVSSFQAAAATLGWELTTPELTQSIVLTRSPGKTPMPKSEELRNFAKTGATICLFLSTTKIPDLAESLKEYYGEEAQAAVVYHASWPDQKVILAKLSDIAVKTEEAGLKKTAMFILRKSPITGRSKLYDADFEHAFRKRRSLG